MLKIGAAWCKTSENTGKNFLSFNIEPELKEMTFNLKGLNLVGFENENKKPGDKSPDYLIYLDSAKE